MTRSSPDIVERLRSNEPLPACPFDRKSPLYLTMPDDKPCPFCGQENTLEGPDKCRGADTRLFAEAADEIERLRAAWEDAEGRADLYANSRPAPSPSSAGIERPTEGMVLAGGDVLLAACSSPNGNLHPWKPFDVAQIAIKVYTAMMTAAYTGCGTPGCTDPNCEYGKRDDAAEAMARSPDAAQPKQQPRLTDNDAGEISVTVDGKEVRGWSYKDDSERRTKMIAAREYVEGWCDGRQA